MKESSNTPIYLATYAFLLEPRLGLLHEQQFHNDRLLLGVHDATVHLEPIHQVGSPWKKLDSG